MELEDKLKITKFIQSELNDSVFYASTNKGIYKSTDKCKSFELIYSQDKIKDIIEISKLNLLISTYKYNGSAFVIKSSNLGETWSDVNEIIDGGRVSFSHSEALPNSLLALVANIKNNTFLNLYKIDLETFNFDTIELDTTKETQAYFNNSICISPFDKDIIYYGGQSLINTFDAGESWNNVYSYPHPDHHHLEFNQFTNQIYTCNDGGVYRKSLLSNEWENISVGLNITQFYSLSLATEKSNYIFAGTQDNSAFIYNNGQWINTFLGDIIDVELLKGNRNKYFFTYPHTPILTNYNEISSLKSLKESFNIKTFFTNKFELNYDGDKFLNEIYLFHDDLYKFNFIDSTWTKEYDFDDELRVIDINFNNNTNKVNYIIKKNKFYSNSKLIDAFSTPISDLENYGNNDSNNNIVIGFSSYNDTLKVLKYDGQGYENISYNLPNVSVNKLLYIHELNQLYAGTDIGLFLFDETIKNWEYINNKKFGATTITDIDYNSGEEYLYLSTFGKGIWRLKILECDLTIPLLSVSGVQEICKGDSVLVEVENINELNNGTFIWNDGVKVSNKNTKRVVNKKGEYYIRYSNENCYVDSKTLLIEHPNSEIYISLSVFDEPLKCEGDSLEIRVNLSNNQYGNIIWSNGQKGRTIFAKENQVYYAMYKDENSCFFSSDSIELKYKEKPVKPEIRRVNNNLFVKNYQKINWYFNDEIINFDNNLLEIKMTGNYIVEYKNSEFCSSYDTIAVEELVKDNIPYIVKIDNRLKSLTITAINDNEDTFSLDLYDLKSKKIIDFKSEKFKGYKEFNINITELAIGFYILKVNINEKAFTKKIQIIK